MMTEIVDVTYHYRLHSELYRSAHLKYRGAKMRESAALENPIVDVDALVAAMDEAGIAKTGLVANVAALDFGRGGRGPLLDENKIDDVKTLIDKHPDRFFGWIGAHPYGRMDMIRYIEHGVRDLGFKGVHIFPHWFAMPVNDRQYYPIYTKCAELDIPVAMQIGIGGSPSAGKVVATPMTIEDVLYDFPELQIMGLHLGHPWQDAFLALGRLYQNFSLVADLPPVTWHKSFVETLREPTDMLGNPLLDWQADNDLPNRFVWGTNGAPGNERGTRSIGQAESLRQTRDLGIPDDLLAAFLGGNAKRILKL